MATTAACWLAEVSAQTPGVNAAAIPDAGAIWNPGEGWVDLPSLVQFLIKDFLGRGGRLVTNAGEVHRSNPCRLRSRRGDRGWGVFRGGCCGLGDWCGRAADAR